MNYYTKQPTQKQRTQRYQKLLKMINQYKLTSQQQRKLQSIKKKTQIQIQLRFLRSQINKSYKLALVEGNPQSDEQQHKFLKKSNRNQVYDLRLQNQRTAYIRQFQQYNPGKRIKSLNIEKYNQQINIQRVKKFQFPIHQNSEKHIRYNLNNNFNTKSISKLPAIKRQNIKTQEKINSPFELKLILNKKLVTEQSQNNGFENYIKKSQQKSQNKLTRKLNHKLYNF